MKNFLFQQPSLLFTQVCRNAVNIGLIASFACTARDIENDTEPLPIITRDQLEQPSAVDSVQANKLIAFDSIVPVLMEYCKKGALIKTKPNGNNAVKIETDGIPLHCSSENNGAWKYVGIEILPHYQLKEINLNNTWFEIWDSTNLILTVFNYKDDDGKWQNTNVWYDDYYLKGYLHGNDIVTSTIPEKELDKIIGKNDLSRAAFDTFLWKFQFIPSVLVDDAFGRIDIYSLLPAYIDGESAPNRMELFFIHDTLVAVKHDRPLKSKNGLPLICDKKVNLTILAEWEDEVKDRFIHLHQDCDQ